MLDFVVTFRFLALTLGRSPFTGVNLRGCGEVQTRGPSGPGSPPWS